MPHSSDPSIGGAAASDPAASDPAGQHRFATEIGRRLGQPDYRPELVKDPVAHWIDDDSWRPPSLPRTTYHTLRTFGGHTLPKVNQRQTHGSRIRLP